MANRFSINITETMVAPGGGVVMSVCSEIVLAMRCPECGQVDFHSLCRFAVGKNIVFELFCSCGTLKFDLYTKDFSQYSITVSCAFCGDSHSYMYSGKNLWSGNLVALTCPHAGLDMAYLGSSDMVCRALANTEGMDGLVDEFGGDGFFHNSKIMNEVLQCLYGIAQRNGLYCQCGSMQIGVEIYPDRLELHCKSCGSINIIYAENEEDLQVIQQVDEIGLAQNGFDYLDSLARSRKIKGPIGPEKRNKT